MLESQARARLQRMVRDTDDPSLTADEIDDLLLLARREDKYGVWADTYTTWKPSAARAVGDLIVPTVRNGHYYRVTVTDGAAGTTEPTWPVTSAATVTADGVTYQEAGSAPWTPTWDLNRAAAEGWSWKAGKVAGQFAFTSDGQSFQRDQVFAMCERQYDRYRRRILSSEPISAGWQRRWATLDTELIP